jgi:hypothetical protein
VRIECRVPCDWSMIDAPFHLGVSMAILLSLQKRGKPVVMTLLSTDTVALASFFVIARLRICRKYYVEDNPFLFDLFCTVKVC